MDIKLTIKNYRCFSDKYPAKISLKKGFFSFVGPNNSGKSTVLKFFYELRNIFQLLVAYDRLSQALRGSQNFSLPTPPIFDTSEIFHNRNSRNLEFEIEVYTLDESVSPKPISLKLGVTIARDRNEFAARLEINGTRVDPGDITLTVDTFRSAKPVTINLYPLMDACSILSRTLYIGAFRNAINLGDQPSYYDISAGQSFIKQWKRIKQGRLKKENKAAIRITQDIQRIFGYRDFEMNPSDADETLSVNIDGESYKLPELGSGLTQFIIVLANASIATPAFILIDEPELNLHPSLQLDFLTTLTSYASEGVLFATHSIGLARSASDVIYSVTQNNDGESIVKAFEDTATLSEFLGEMSYSGYEELGFKKILLVEGTTDVRAITQFLRLYKKEHEIVILPLGGDTLINENSLYQLKEIKRISKKVFTLIDSEKNSEGDELSIKRKKFAENCTKAGIKRHILKYRSLENYFTQDAVARVKGEKYRALSPYEKRGDVDPVWAKEENWKIAREMSQADIEKTDLGKFLKKVCG